MWLYQKVVRQKTQKEWQTVWPWSGPTSIAQTCLQVCLKTSYWILKHRLYEGSDMKIKFGLYTCSSLLFTASYLTISQELPVRSLNDETTKTAVHRNLASGRLDTNSSRTAFHTSDVALTYVLQTIWCQVGTDVTYLSFSDNIGCDPGLWLFLGVIIIIVRVFD